MMSQLIRAGLAAVLLLFSQTPCIAQQYDTGWMKMNSIEFQDLQTNGMDVRVNNFIVNIGSNFMLGNGPVLEFAASAINRGRENRRVSIQLISQDKQGKMAFALSAQPSLFMIQSGKSEEIKTNILVNNISLENIDVYWVRVIMN